MSVFDNFSEPNQDWFCRFETELISAHCYWYQDDNEIIITDWGVKGKKRQGASRHTLKTLRKIFDRISIEGSHPADDKENPEAFMFWITMLREGLVDYVSDTNGVEYSRSTFEKI